MVSRLPAAQNFAEFDIAASGAATAGRKVVRIQDLPLPRPLVCRLH